MSKFVMLVGLPGSGKSTYTKRVYKNASDTVILSSDEIRASMGFKPNEGHPEVFSEMLKRTKMSLQAGKDVVYDATNLSRKHRIATLQEVRKFCDSRECVLFATPVNICVEHDKWRKATVGASVIFRMLKSFNVPMLCEGFDKINVLASEVFVNNLDSILDFTKNFKQDNPHHSLVLYDHLKKTEAYVKERTNKVSVIEAALYHDIGKIWTKTFINASGVKTDIAHFYNHENVGAYMYLVSKAIDSEETGAEVKNAQTLYTVSLINWHMRPYLEMNNEKREREYKMLGEDFVNDILLIHEADRQAH